MKGSAILCSLLRHSVTMLSDQPHCVAISIQDENSRPDYKHPGTREQQQQYASLLCTLLVCLLNKRKKKKTKRNAFFWCYPQEKTFS